MRRWRVALLVVAAGVSLAAQAAPALVWPLDSTPAAVMPGRLDRREPSVAVLPARGRDLLVVGALRTTATGVDLVGSASHLDRVQRGTYSSAFGRFSATPVLDDLAGLSLGRGDLDDLYECRVGNCGLKLTEPEITRAQQAIAGAGRAWQPAATAVFRQILLDRLRAFERGRFGAVPALRDKSRPTLLATEARTLADSAVFDRWTSSPCVRAALGDDQGGDDVTTFAFWSVDHFGGKPMTSITRVTATACRDDGATEAIIVARQIFASHYATGSIGVTTIARDAVGGRYLIYLNASRLDIFDGLFGGMARRAVEGRIRTDAPAVLESLRRRVEAVARRDLPSESASAWPCSASGANRDCR